MSILCQKTIASKISFEGIGVHTGKRVKIEILPAKPDTGILFERTDLKNNNQVVPNYLNVVDTNLCTTISNEFGELFTNESIT